MKKEIDNERLQLENELLMNCSKAQAINKYIDELEENSKLSELWCKSQEENRKLKEVIDRAIEYLETKRIREKAIVDVDVLEGILNEVK